MSAYNYILIDKICPACSAKESLIAQTHVASDYDGDEFGRFHDALYRVGEQMRWWPPEHRKHGEWRNGNRKEPDDIPSNEEYECCYTTCSDCRAKFFSVIKFLDVTPISVLDFGQESDWPTSFYL